MPAVQFNCPHCQGMFQVDSALAGMQVSCPHCRQVATLPASMEAPPSPQPVPVPAAPQQPPRPIAPAPAPTYPPAPSSPMISPASGPTAGGGLMQFACPQCNGEFRVGTAMAGQRVSCPHCRSTVTVPQDAAPPSSPSRAIPQPAPAPAPVQPSPTTPSPTSVQGPVAPQPAPAPGSAIDSTVPSTPSASDAMYPPGYTAASADKEAAPAPMSPQKEGIGTSSANQFYPPGFGEAAKGGAADASQSVSPQPAPPADMLPPGATTETASVEHVTSAPASPVEQNPAAFAPAAPTWSISPTGPMSPAVPFASPSGGATSPASKKSVDELLPPGATVTADAPATTTAPSTIGSSPLPIDTPAPATAKDTIAIPTADGGYVTVRDSVKTIAYGGEEFEVRRLTPEERQRRRFIKNIIMAILGVLFLTVVTVVLMALT